MSAVISDLNLPAVEPELPPLTSNDLEGIAAKYSSLFTTYSNDRLIAEQRWLRNLRQWLGIYDPDIESQLGNDRSKAYPRITRIKCVSVVSRLMNLMFPGNERNWALDAGPEPDMAPEDVQAAIEKVVQAQQAAGLPPELTDEMVRDAVQELAKEKAARLSAVIDDYLQELGGDQSQDHISLNRQVISSGVMYGTGVMLGPFVRTQKQVRWGVQDGLPARIETEKYKPQFEFLTVWDYFPDMSAKNLRDNDGYFVRRIMTRKQVRDLSERPDFFGTIIQSYLAFEGKQGNYKPRTIDTELKTLGVKVNVNEQTTETSKYEVLTWYGPVPVKMLLQARVPREEDIDTELPGEVWMLGGKVIKVAVNPWYDLGADISTCHTFTFDVDDTSPLGNGLPNVVRDSQLSICAATRMTLDNSSVVCGPNLELNVDLLRPDQDLTSIHAYKRWYREGTGADAQQAAVRNVNIDSHIPELLSVIRLFMDFADAETFVGPATGGDMSRGPSEPLRTAAGASMLRGDAALPFKDIVRNFDMFTQSVIYSLVWFCRKLGQHPEAEGDFNVIARGATSLISKEVRGMQIDQLANTLRPEEMEHVDPRLMVEQRFAVRDLTDMLLPVAEVRRRQQAAQQEAAEAKTLQTEAIRAEIRDVLSGAFKNISQGQKNMAATEKTRAEVVNTALDTLLGGVQNGEQPSAPEQQQAVPGVGGGGP